MHLSRYGIQEFKLVKLFTELGFKVKLKVNFINCSVILADLVDAFI